MHNIPNDYFLDTDDNMLIFLEKQGEECIKEIHQSNITNKESAYKLLNILMVGISLSFLFLSQKQTWDCFTAGITIFTLCWASCATYLVLFNLSIKKRGLISASPNLLYTEDYKTINASDYDNLKDKGFRSLCSPLAVMRRYKLIDLCMTCNGLLITNQEAGKHLSRVRIATILTPIISVMVSIIIYCFS